MTMPIFPFIVIPAKAGNEVTVRSIHHPPLKFNPPVMDPRLRGGDEKVEH